MKTSELRKQLKALGYKLQITSSSLGRHAGIIHIASGCKHGNVEGAEGVEERWGPFRKFALEHKEELAQWAKEEGVFGVKSWTDQIGTI